MSLIDGNNIDIINNEYKYLIADRLIAQNIQLILNDYQESSRLEVKNRKENFLRYKNTLRKDNIIVIDNRVYNAEEILKEIRRNFRLPKSSSVLTPKSVAFDMTNLIDADTFASNTTFLCIYSKDGVYMNELLDKIMSDDANLKINKEDNYKDKASRLKNFFKNQLYIITDTPEHYTLTIDNCINTLIKYANSIDIHWESNHDFWILPNIILIDNYNELIHDYYNKENILQLLKKEFGRRYFDITIGNPPYNDGADLDFVELAYNLSDKYACIITPAKWQTAEATQRVVSDINYGEFREYLVPHMSYVCFYPCCKDVFDTYQTDGITYFILDKELHDTCTIENKCLDIKYFNSIEVRDIRSEQSLLNIGNEIIEYLGRYSKWTFPELTGNKHYEVWMNTKISGWNWFDTKLPRFLLGVSEILDKRKGEEHTGERKCIFESDSIEECESFISWIYSKFTRFFLLPNMSKLNNIQTNHCFRFVPSPPFGLNHIYSDSELYKYFKLPQKYIDIIEDTIRERDFS